ncbi:MAG: L-threonylcarbamoyladenylate synthase [Burkholderiaceae bacterium]
MSVAIDARLRAAIEQAAARLDEGGLVAFPTETVYGLGADAASAAAVAAIFAAKGRPSDHPLIVHVPVGSDLLQWASGIPSLAQRLVDRFWPGPLTLILPRRPGVGDAAAGGQASIGLRCPAHPVAQALLIEYASLREIRDRHAPIGIAAPSANRFGHVSPTSAQHVRDEFGDTADILVVDGGDCPVGIESTIVDCSRLAAAGPVLLRPGSITAAMLAEIIGHEPGAADRDAPRASGTLATHYAPSTPLRLVDRDRLEEAGGDVAVLAWSFDPSSTQPSSLRAPADATGYAHALYASLRALDVRGAREIWVERPPTTSEWDGVNDRLTRAAAGTV